MSFSSQIVYDINATVSSARSVMTAAGAYKNTFNSNYASANNVFADVSAIASISTSYDLSGSLENAIGDPFIITEIQNIQIINKSISSALTVLGAATDIPVLSSAGSVIPIGTSGRINLDYPRGLTVTATTADTITLRGTGARFEIMVIGTDA